MGVIRLNYESSQKWKLCLIIGLAWLIMVGGCGGADRDESSQSGCEVETRADSYVQGLEKSGDVYTLALFEAIPGPPERGDNTWLIDLYEGGMQVRTATITVKPWMPDHGHGATPPYFKARRPAPEQAFQVGPMNLFMPGYWTMTLSVETTKATDEIVLGFCIEG